MTGLPDAIDAFAEELITEARGVPSDQFGDKVKLLAALVRLRPKAGAASGEATGPGLAFFRNGGVDDAASSSDDGAGKRKHRGRSSAQAGG